MANGTLARPIGRVRLAKTPVPKKAPPKSEDPVEEKSSSNPIAYIVVGILGLLGLGAMALIAIALVVGLFWGGMTLFAGRPANTPTETRQKAQEAGFNQFWGDLTEAR